MKLMSFRRSDGTESWGVVEGDHVTDGASVAPTLRSALAAAYGPRRTQAQAQAALRPPADAPHYLLDRLTFLPPIPNSDKIICVGLNYLTHVLEGGRARNDQPIVFSRWANSQVGHGQPLIRPLASETLDFEGELAVVIGRPCRHASAADAMGYIAGYSCYNDGSVREWQRHTSQYTPGKNFPSTGGFGPWIVTPDEAGDIGYASLVTRVNGEEMQRATIDDLVFGIPSMIAYCSTFTRLEPGDVIVTGTTGGVGRYRTPPVWLKPGDVVEVEVSGVGTLRNPVELESILVV